MEVLTERQAKFREVVVGRVVQPLWYAISQLVGAPQSQLIQIGEIAQ